MAVGQYLPVVVTTTQTVQSGTRRIKMCYWYNPANVGDTVTLQDDNGSAIWQGRCEVQNQSQLITFPREIEVTGYQVPTLTSGTLYIYVT
jgi:hypothetical protein